MPNDQTTVIHGKDYAATASVAWCGDEIGQNWQSFDDRKGALQFTSAVNCAACLAVARGEKVDHPVHYGGVDNPYEAIKVIEAWSLGFCLGNAVKYISRAGKKSNESTLDDLKKARWYLDREIQNVEKSEKK